MTTTTDETLDPSDIPLHLIVTLLAPMFLGFTAGDFGLARMAALGTIDAYRTRTHADLLTAAQIIGFGLAALASLGLSMAGDISVPMVLRLRANANACNRSAEQNRRALAKSQSAHPQPHPAPPEPDIPPTCPDTADQPETDGLLSPEAARQLADESLARLDQPAGHIPVPSPPPITATVRSQAEKRNQEMWAIAMAKEASEITASIPNLPPAEREAATMRAAMLGSTAHDLIHGAPVAPLKPGALAGIIRPDANRKPPPP